MGMNTCETLMWQLGYVDRHMSDFPFFLPPREKLTKSNILEGAILSHAYSYLDLESPLTSICAPPPRLPSPLKMQIKWYITCIQCVQSVAAEYARKDSSQLIIWHDNFDLLFIYLLTNLFIFMFCFECMQWLHWKRPWTFYWFVLFCDGLFNLGLWFTVRNEHHSGRGAAFTTH